VEFNFEIIIFWIVHEFWVSDRGWLWLF